MNRLTNYLLLCIALFFGIAILSDRLSKLHFFEGMTYDSESRDDEDEENVEYDESNATEMPLDEEEENIDYDEEEENIDYDESNETEMPPDEEEENIDYDESNETEREVKTHPF